MYLEIKTDRVVLRPLNIKDLITVHEYASDIENTQFMVHLPNRTIEETSRFLTKVTNEWKKETPDYYEFAIILKDRQIGAVSVRLSPQRSKGILGWILNKKYWSKGYGTEAAVAIRNFAINELKVTELVAHCDIRNIASSKIMRKLGLSLESDDGFREYPTTGDTVRELVYRYEIL